MQAKMRLVKQDQIVVVEEQLRTSGGEAERKRSLWDIPFAAFLGVTPEDIVTLEVYSVFSCMISSMLGCLHTAYQGYLGAKRIDTAEERQRVEKLCDMRRQLEVSCCRV